MSVTSGRSVVFSVYLIQHYVIKFVSDFRQISGFLCVLDTTLCDKVCQWFQADQWFSLCTSVSSTNDTDLHSISEILLKVTLNSITLSHPPHPLLFVSELHWQLVSVLTSSQVDRGFKSWLDQTKDYQVLYNWYLLLIHWVCSIKEQRLVVAQNQYTWIDQHVYLWFVLSVS